MVFSSLLFLFRFLPAVLILYYIAPRKLRNVILLLFSLFFYAWGEPKYVFLMLFAVVFNLFLTPGTPAVTIWKLKITWEGIEMASKMAVRLVMLIIGSSLMTLTTTPNI